MKIAVTAASGQLGGAIARHLIQTIGYEQVIAIARTPKKASGLGVEVRKGDYDVFDDFKEALVGVDAVLLVSSMAAPELRPRQHLNVIEAARESGVKKLVYTSIIGDEKRSGFQRIVASNRQTEADLKASGLTYAIGRNGLYIEPDIEYIQHYIKEGFIANSAGAGKCSYTSRLELAEAYTQLLLHEQYANEVYNLTGEAITQQELVEILNQLYQTKLHYQPESVEAYTAARKVALGEFLGTVIGGIYESIQLGAFHVPSDFEEIMGRKHLSPLDMVKQVKEYFDKEG